MPVRWPDHAILSRPGRYARQTDIPQIEGCPGNAGYPRIEHPQQPGAGRARSIDFLGKELRLHCIDRLKKLIQPLPIHLELESAISSILRTGYVSRNPVHAATWRHLHTLSTNRRDLALFHSSASTFSLVGLSGIGKTTALNAVLSLYPQKIVHCRYLPYRHVAKAKIMAIAGRSNVERECHTPACIFSGDIAG
jgi:hypothetical protein